MTPEAQKRKWYLGVLFSTQTAFVITYIYSMYNKTPYVFYSNNK